MNIDMHSVTFYVQYSIKWIKYNHSYIVPMCLQWKTNSHTPTHKSSSSAYRMSWSVSSTWWRRWTVVSSSTIRIGHSSNTQQTSVPTNLYSSWHGWCSIQVFCCQFANNFFHQRVWFMFCAIFFHSLLALDGNLFKRWSVVSLGDVWAFIPRGYIGLYPLGIYWPLLLEDFGQSTQYSCTHTHRWYIAIYP